MRQRVCVFCGSSSGNKTVYGVAADEVGRLLAHSGMELVYGGGNVGLMGRVADSCLRHGGSVIGVIPRSLMEKEIAHRGLTQLHIVESMHARKAMMADLADAFLALPGGFGTWDEFCEILTWSQLGLQRKACALLNVNGYYDALLHMADRAVAEGFLSAPHRRLLLSGSNPEPLLGRLLTYQPPVVDKWAKPVAREQP